MKKLLFFTRYFFDNKTRFLLGVCLSLLVAFSSVALLALSGWFIAASAFSGLQATTAANFNYFLPAAIIRFLALLRIGSRYLDRVLSHELTFHILAKLRIWFYEKLLPLSPAKLLSQRSGDLLNRMIHDIDTLDHLYINVLSPFFIALMLIMTSTGFIAYFSTTLAYICGLSMLLSIVLITIVALKKGLQIGHAIQASTANLRTSTIHALQGLIDLLLFLKKSERTTLLAEKNHALLEAQKKLSALKGIILSLMAFFSGITLLLVLWVGVNTHTNGAILTMIALLILAVFDQLLLLPLSALTLTKTIAAANRITAITEEKPAVVFSKDAAITDHSLTIKQVNFHYPNHPLILNNINLSVPAKTLLAITGFSGSGKSTLLNLIARVYDPSSGGIFLGNTPLNAISENTLRHTISLVTQQIHIFNGSVLDNLTLLDPAFSEEACFDILEKMCLADLMVNLPEKLQTPMGEFGKQFSGGQIRRIAIARALLHNAPILLLDEPSTGLDHQTFDTLWKNCEKIFSEKTLIIATHDQNVLRKINEKYCVNLLL